MNRINLHAALRHLLAALAHSVHACARTQAMVRVAIGKYMTLAASWAAA